jgi:hypothetical protein
MSEELKAVIPQEIQARIDGEIKQLLEGARIEKIEKPEEAAAVGELGKKLKAEYDLLEKERDGLVRPLNTVVDEYNAFFKGSKGCLTAIKGVMENCKSLIVRWNQKLADEQRERQRIADEKAAADRRKLEEEAEKKRQEAEKQRREAEEKRLAAQKVADEEERKKLEAEAAKLELKAEKTELKADEKAALSTTVVAPIVSASAPKIKGYSGYEKFYAEVTDKKEFVLWCVANGQWQYLDINQSALDKVAAVLKENFKADGIVVKSKLQNSVRSAA